jgi:hypothetical protein
MVDEAVERTHGRLTQGAEPCRIHPSQQDSKSSWEVAVRGLDCMDWDLMVPLELSNHLLRCHNSIYEHFSKAEVGEAGAASVILEADDFLGAPLVL